jgi:pimeloyl-ACP methyl ester carboxylesterase
MRGLAVLVATVALLAAAAPAAAQAPGVPPPGANDFSCRPVLPPVILVHGTFGDMTVSWNLFSPALKAAGHCVFALDLVRRGMAPVDRSADKLSAFIDEVLTRTGARQVSIVGHSQGGALGRYMVRSRGKHGAIDDVVALAPPSHGTTNPLAPGAGFFCPACAQQTPGSRFMKRLNRPPEAPPPASYTVISTRYDEVVTPYRSQAVEGATNVVLQDRCPEDITEHVGIIYDPIALQWTLNALARPGPADPAFVPLCSDAVPARLPFAFVARRRAALDADSAGVPVACVAAAGRCVGRVAVRDRSRRLGTARFDLPGAATQTVRVPLRRAPRGRATATVVTLQPGGFVKASLKLRRRDH